MKIIIPKKYQEFKNNFQVNYNRMDNQLEQIINFNKNLIVDSLNTNNFEYYYKYFKNLVFDNIILIVLFYLFITPYFFRMNGQNKNFNWWMLLLIPTIVLVYYFTKILYRRYSKIGNMLRTNECLELSNQIIINKTIKPIETKKELLSKPFNEFIVNTSHNSYVPCTQNIDVSSIEAIKYCLVMGARVIELDCYAKNNTGNNPEDCIDIIAKYGFLTSDPLIVCLELNTNKLLLTQKRMKEIILQKIGNKLLDKSYKISNKTDRKIFTNQPIGNLLNKVIFICGGGYTEELVDIIDGSFNENQYFSNTENLNPLLENLNNTRIVQRIYPAGNISGHLSYNYDPTKFWKNKYQMVALNFQVVDDNLMKNVAMFKSHSFVHYSELK